jgi:putative hydrolase
MSPSRAAAFTLPARELLERLPAWECHMHTTFSDGAAGVAECAARARALGLTRIIFTEHTEPWKAKGQDWFRRYAAEVRAAARAHEGAMEVFLGLEAPAVDYHGGLELTDAMRAEADFLLGTAHRYPGLGDRRTRDLAPEECIELEWKTLMALANTPGIDAIAHIGGTCGLYCAPFPEELLVDVVREATRNGLAVELNTRYHRPISRLLDICIREDARVTIGSDAHTLDEIGGAYAALLAQRGNDAP